MRPARGDALNTDLKSLRPNHLLPEDGRIGWIVDVRAERAAAESHLSPHLRVVTADKLHRGGRSGQFRSARLTDRHLTLVDRPIERGKGHAVPRSGREPCGRPRELFLEFGDGYFPSGAELSLDLADFRYEGDGPPSLWRSRRTARSSWVGAALPSTAGGLRPGSPSDPAPRLPRAVPGGRAREGLALSARFVTTNYDGVLEHALADRAENSTSSLMWPTARGRQVPPLPSGGEPALIRDPSTYKGLFIGADDDPQNPRDVRPDRLHGGQLRDLGEPVHRLPDDRRLGRDPRLP